MRTSKTKNGLKVNAIAGTYVVVLGFNLQQSKCKGLLGFSILRKNHKTGEVKYLEGMKAFAETDPGFPPGAVYPTNEHPIQIFQWADYSAFPGGTYTYKVTALKGTPTKLVPFISVSIQVTTEDPETGDHDVYFNRGTAASQEYVRRFGNKKPDKVPNNRAFSWLSRGLYEALEGFLNSCKPKTHSLRIAAYEFNYDGFLDLINRTIKRGVEIEIIYDARKASPRDKNRLQVKKYKLEDYCYERTIPKSYISHNKFIVKLQKGRPVSLLTGGTNFSEGGIFGHSNVAHIVEDAKIAKIYFEYWNNLSKDPDMGSLTTAVEQITPLPGIPVPKGTTVLFSPRKSEDALNFYGDLALKAKNGLFMTFAFGMNDVFKNVYTNSSAKFRLALLEQKTRPMKKDDPQKIIEEKAIQTLRNMPENVFAVGNYIKTNEFDGWAIEKLTNLNKNVKYMHNKFMLIDPLSNDPVVVVGSANFSIASTTKNDENMLIIRGNKRVADIYLGEFMRLFSHHSFRESLTWRKPNEPPKPLRTDDWWKESFGNTPNASKRIYFGS